MGYGDDLLITSFASKIKQKYPDRQIVIGKASAKKAYHSIVYENNPNISDCRNLDPKKPIHIIDYHPGNRPYIDYKKSTNTNYIWNYKFKPVVGELYFNENELSNADKIINDSKIFWKKNNESDFNKIIFMETSSTKINDKNFNIKHKNKDWGYNNWQSLINNIKKDYLIIHSVHGETKKFNGVFSPSNLDFRLACATMKKCDLYVGPEGGFGHVAAALKKRAVIYFGGWIPPDIIGYDFHENIYFKHKQSPCGNYRDICNHCSEAREKITVDIFERKIRSI